MVPQLPRQFSKLPGTEIEILHFPFDLKILSSLIHSVPLNIYAKDLNGKFIFANLNYCQSVGKHLGEILGKTDYDIHPQDLADKYLADDHLIITSGETRMIEESWQSIGGKTHYIQVIKTPLYDNENPNKVLGTTGVFWEITERKKVEIQVREERKFLRTIIDTIPALIYVKDRDGKFIIANRAQSVFVGATSSEALIGKSDFDFYPKEIADSFAKVEEKIFQTEEPVIDLVESFIVKGKKHWLSTSKKPLRNLDGTVVGLVGVGHDITSSKKIEEKLRESEERYAAVVNQAIEGIYLVDPVTKQILDSNESFQKILGYRAEELHRCLVYDFVIHDHDEINTIIKSVVDQDSVLVGERKYRIKNGRLIDVEESAKMINFGGKKVILIITRDISEKKNAEKERELLKEQLRQAQKFEALGTLAGSVAHDLNNILSGIVGYPELLLTNLPQDSDLRKPLEAIHDSGVRAATVVADLLTIARGVASTKQVCSLNVLVKEFISSPECREIQSLYPDISYRHQLHEDLSDILCSPVHVKKCIMNLVSNATEAMSTKGEICIETLNQYMDVTQAEMNGLDRGTYAVLSVCDTGSGIADIDMKRIFEPFHTRKEIGRSGTGLGLTVVWNTMNDHGGTVTVKSNKDGSCFSLFFPHCKKAAGSKIEQTHVVQKTNKNAHILVIDDEPLLREISSKMLEALGYTVDTVASGELAIQFVKNTSVDLLVIDMLMEPGMNGRRTFEEIQKTHPDIKALIASGFSNNEDVQATLQHGAKGFIQKPYSMEKLGLAVKKALEGTSSKK